MTASTTDWLKNARASSSNEETGVMSPRSTDNANEAATGIASNDVGNLEKRPRVALPEGSILGSYRVVKELGHGGMGFVYEGEHVTLGRRVALKVLPPDLAGDKNAVRRFFAEARAVNEVQHSGLIEIVDFHEGGDDATFYVMELLDGEDCAERLLSGGAFSVADVYEIALQVADAMSAVHNRNIIHRDLKPHNIFLVINDDEKPRVKVIDFGIAKLQGELAAFAPEMTAAGSIVGTPEYMSPEQAGGQPVDTRADIYSLGVVLFELATGKKPFTGNSFGEFLVRHLTMEPPKLRDVGGPDLPEALEHVIDLCLEKDPSDRPDTMRALHGLLVDAQNNTLVTPERVHTSSTTTVRQGRRMWMAAAAVSLIVGGGVFATRSLGDAVADKPITAIDETPIVKTLTVRIESSPQGAEIFHADTGKKLGTTPLRLEMDDDESRVSRVLLKLDGHLDGRIEIPQGATFVSTTLAARPVSPPPTATPSTPTNEPDRRSKPVTKKPKNQRDSSTGSDDGASQTPKVRRDPALDRRATIDPFAE